MTERADIEHELQRRARAYRQLLSGSEALLAGSRLYWTERGLLQLVRTIASQRLGQLAAVMPDRATPAAAPTVLREAMLEAMAEAALGGHELGEWETVENGYEARCSLCGMSTWLGYEGLRYSILEDECSGAAGHE